ncbi:MAG: KH domain-containing protein [Candidatus Aenigmatarchaeota archaeon]
MAEDLKKKLEKMMDVEINEVMEEEDVIRVDIDEEMIGKAIGPGGSNVRAAEKVLGKDIEVIKEDEE